MAGLLLDRIGREPKRTAAERGDATFGLAPRSAKSVPARACNERARERLRRAAGARS
jgi:hypothetical protein